jgi:hypothetical protein
VQQRAHPRPYVDSAATRRPAAARAEATLWFAVASITGAALLYVVYALF